MGWISGVRVWPRKDSSKYCGSWSASAQAHKVKPHQKDTRGDNLLLNILKLRWMAAK